MEIKEMTIEEIEARKAAVVTESAEARGEDLDNLEKEMDSLNEELEARKAEIEKREAIVAEAEASGVAEEIIPDTKIEEERKMSFEKDTVEYRNAWLKNMMGAPLNEEERAAMATVDVVPVITENTIINRLKENDLLKYIDFTQYEGAVNIPCYTTNGDAAWDTANEQQDAIGHVALGLYQLIKTVEVPGVKADMSIDAFEAKLVEALANKVEAALQNAVILGTGSGQPQGINVAHATADGTFTRAGITKADLMGIMGELPGEYQKDAVWIMPTKCFYEAMAVCDLPGFVALNAELKPVIGGKPVVMDDACVISSTDTIFFGGAKAYHLNVGGGIKVDKDASVGFKTNAINYRAVAYADGKLDNVDAFVKYTRATV